MADVSFILGVLGNIMALLVFISPVKTFWGIVKNKSTQEFKSLPYICTLLSTSLWTYYGLIKPGGLLIFTINAAGSALEAVYVILFIIYAPKGIRLRTVVLAVFVDIVFFATVFLVTFLALNQHMRITVIGILCVFLTLSMYGSPLSVMRTVMATKSVEFMPFFLSLFLFLNGGVWAVWAVLQHDIFVGIPNGIGFGLGGVQLLLYVIYRKGKPRREEITEEEVKPDGLKLGSNIEMGGRDEFSAAHHIPESKSHSRNILKGIVSSSG